MPLDPEKLRIFGQKMDQMNRMLREQQIRDSIQRKDPELDPRTGKPPQDFKHGGTVKKTGVYKLHKGEKVVPARAAEKTKRGK